MPLRPVAVDARRLSVELGRVAAPFLEIAGRLVDHVLRPVAPVLEPTPDVMLVRHLELQHLGRWIYLPGRPAKGGPRLAAEPSIAATAGRLVGIRPGKIGMHAGVLDTRTLVLSQGSALAELPVDVADPVYVAPREW